MRGFAIWFEANDDEMFIIIYAENSEEATDMFHRYRPENPVVDICEI